MRLRLGVRGREALVVSLLTLLVVSTATAIHLSQLSRVVVQEAVKQAELIAKQIYAQTSRALAAHAGRRSARRAAGGSGAAQLPRRERRVLAAPGLRARHRPHRHRAAPHRAPEGGQAGAGPPEPRRAPEGGHPEPLLRALHRGPHLRDGAADDAQRPALRVDPSRRLDHAPAARGHRIAPAEPGGGRGRAAAGLARRDGAGAAHGAADPRHRRPGRPDPPRRAAGGHAGARWAATSSRSCPPSSRVSGASCRRTGCRRSARRRTCRGWSTSWKTG